MTEEETKKAEEKKETKDEKTPPPETSEPKEKKEEAPAQVKKKINKMTHAEIDAKLKEIKETMGGWDSKYAQHLLKRKNNLSSEKSE